MALLHPGSVARSIRWTIVIRIMAIIGDRSSMPKEVNLRIGARIGSVIW